MSYDFALDSQELLENGQAKLLFDSCPLLSPLDSYRYELGKSLVELYEGDGSISLHIVIRGQSRKDLAAYALVKRLYDWLCAVTPFDWELFTAAESEQTPNRYRPTERFPEPDLPFDDETDIYVFDVAASSDAQASVFWVA